ncbi:hypothetical protein HPG69_009780 [Diceros bicornis minor]|uniref:Uncharacterized protein n=1 Tax=Diceros bicornis minor TaxID=77932 RepID=A0A7J7EYK0_DICBM|nr:hypothetical protein HPG69_009780 [Diceros bicornis minor]
MRQMLPFLG